MEPGDRSDLGSCRKRAAAWETLRRGRPCRDSWPACGRRFTARLCIDRRRRGALWWPASSSRLVEETRRRDSDHSEDRTFGDAPSPPPPGLGEESLRVTQSCLARGLVDEGHSESICTKGMNLEPYIGGNAVAARDRGHRKFEITSRFVIGRDDGGLVRS